ncbi:MAG: type II secretion system F family protein, partial [Gammaproteobacteria bacterium]|nr:type II secretion system F family protein [Gammaproteobacteria bacterium]
AAAIQKIREDVATGQQLQLAMQQSKLFPNMAVQMVAIGEETGALDSMLSKVADFYEQEVDDAVDGLSSLMEPVIIVVIGGLIGGLVLAMYMPVFQIGNAL